MLAKRFGFPFVFVVLVAPVRAQCYHEKIPAPNPAQSGQFTATMQFLDDQLIEGSPIANAVHVFDRVGQDLVLSQVLVPSDLYVSQWFGIVAAAPGLLCVGSPNDTDQALNAGSVYSYVQGPGGWQFETELHASDAAAYDDFGGSVSITPNGHFLFVGDPFKSDLQTGAGAVYVFERIGGAWVERQRLNASDVFGGSKFGTEVCATNDRLVVTAFTAPPLFEGAAYIFELDSGTGLWSETAKVVSPNPSGYDWFGVSCDFDGDRLLVGAMGWYNQRGAVYLFEYDGLDWVFQRMFTSEHPAPDQATGLAVGLLEDGVLFKTEDPSVAASYAGVVNYWRETGTGWYLVDRMIPFDSVSELAFGHTMEVGPDMLYFGALDDSVFENAGALYTYTRPIVTRYCPASANSSGAAARIDWRGSTVLAQDSFELEASGGPPQQPGVFYFGPNQIAMPFGNGMRCVGGSTVRVPPVQLDAAGVAHSELPLVNFPQLLPASTYNFQFWFRDPAAGGAFFDLSDAIQIRFCQ